MKRPVRSTKLFAQARQILPGGVNSPVRAFQGVGGIPLFVTRAAGATITDVDGNRYIDYVMSWGPLIHGHAPAGLVKAIARTARLGTSFGAPSPLEHELGEQVRALMPSMERSEEHTSELQSQSNLVCRLLLEKKKVALLIHRRGTVAWKASIDSYFHEVYWPRHNYLLSFHSSRYTSVPSPSINPPDASDQPVD